MLSSHGNTRANAYDGDMTDTQWVTIERPGYFGARRDAVHADLDARHGPENWRLAWIVDGEPFSREQMTMLYEDSYFAFLSRETDILEQLLREACDVYDDQPSNVHSGLDYAIQETDRTHVQDIAIRRVVARLGRVFSGDQLIRIRDKDGNHPLSMTLSPGHVPFHRRDLLMTPEITGWWQPQSVESFYQSNKVLQIRS